MIKKINKRGELSTQQIILLIILIASFVVILFFYFRLNLGKESEAELCHNSVVLRGSSVIPSDATPLKCSRQYICLTNDGTCEGQVKTNVEKVKTEDEVLEVLANQLTECWWKFGAGEVDYIGSDITKNNYCSICSQVLFDDSLKEVPGFEDGTISKDRLYIYLTEHNYSKEQTYFEFLFGTNDLQNLKNNVLGSQGNNEGVGTFGNIEIGKNQYYVITGITSEIGNTYKWIGGGLAVAGVVLGATTGLGYIGGAIIVGTGIATGFTGEDVAGLFEPEIGAITVKGRGIPNNFMSPTIQEISSEKIKGLNCEEIITLG